MTNNPGPPRDHEPASDSRDPASSAPGADHQPAQLDEAGLAKLLRAPGELTAAELTALDRLDGGWRPHPDDEAAYDNGDPGCDEADLGSAPEWAELAGDDEDQPRAAEALEAGFTHRYGGTGTGFRAGGPLDEMPPGPDLAWHAEQARQRGLDALSDDELIGLLGGTRRLSSRAAELELAAVAELDARRAGPDGREGEHVAEELAAALTLTGRSAALLLELSRQLERLPQTAALLAAGVIDRARAVVIAGHLAPLDDDAAAAVESLVAPRAGAMTTGQLGAACQRAVLAHDPQAAARRKAKAERDARVECWAEPSGTGAIAGRDLNLAAVIAADQHLDAAARWLQRHGAPGTLDQLRAQTFLARLAGRPLESLLPTAPDTARPDDPASPAPAGPAAGRRPGGGGPGSGSDPATTGHPSPDPDPDPDPGPWPTGPAWPAGLGGSVNLVLPATTWLGLTDTPGEIAGTGAADAATCRDLAAALAAHPGSRWCLTLTGHNGRAVAHGCARAGPGPPATADPAAWLRQIPLTTLESGTCAHRRETAAYRPPPSLRHLIKIRDRRCGYPGCRRPATRCDDDHTLAHHKGGRTCECNLYPLCRSHHQAKQAPGWHLDQPEPGLLTWTLPSGRRYTTTPEPYPA
jgi:hypothetical protein